ncbi:MAG TPA: hypothetical protein RMH99_32115 [Sandaracinaceae bacterium LLY-WYZ-13_1]|nr:hypothetical protein [Sandaracinaceae bacterium LLY-WYZ-13_1]
MPSEHPSPFRVLSLDPAAEREAATLRLVGGVVCALGAVALAGLDPPPIGWVVAALGLVGAVFWFRRWARARRVVHDAAHHRLALDPDGLRLVEGDREQAAPWDTVVDVEADEDRLVVRVTRERGDAVLIEPRYGGLGMHDLERAVRRAWDAARARAASAAPPS